MRKRQSSEKRKRQQARATIVLLFWLVQPVLARAQENTKPKVTGSTSVRCEAELALWLGDQAGIPASVIRAARRHLETVFRAIGVRLVWLEDPRDPLKPLVVIVVPDARATAFHVRDTDALGVTWYAREGGGTPFVFYGRVEHAAANNRVDTAMVLGSALAHEIAHALLGRGAHADSGLMLRGWDEQQFRSIRSGVLLFSNLDGRALRKALRSNTTASCQWNP